MGHRSPEVFVDMHQVWGYYHPDEFGEFGQDPLLRKFIWFHDVLNLLSIIASPLIGLIRSVIVVYFLWKLDKANQKNYSFDLLAAERFCYMELARGVMEFFFLGPILGIVVDGFVTIKEHEQQIVSYLRA